jgi:glycosyltransferase involved in cell wall biosynthesis
VYNHANYLEQCIDSAINQVIPFDEIVIVDDCSPDPSVQKILSKYKKTDRVRLYKNKENLGIASTQNYAISLCNSDFIAFLDCDDYLEREARAGFDSYYKIKPGDYFFSNRIEVIQGGGVRRVDVSSHIYEYETLTQCLLEHMVASHFKVIRKECLDKIGGFPSNTDGVQDWVVAVNIITDTNAVHMAEYLYFHRIHPAQTTGQDSVRYMSVVNAERERRLSIMGLKSSAQRDRVRNLARYMGRVAQMPKGAFFLRDGLMQPWASSLVLADRPTEPCLLIYSPKYHERIAQDFYLCRSVGAETVMIVDHRIPDSIAITRWANAFIDHIICLDSVARLAIEPWVADKAKIVQGNSGDVRRAPRIEDQHD